MSATQGAFEDFKARVDNVLPAKEAKAIRKKLKLSQREASELLGGGPRSFQKYEAGTVRLSVAMSNLLRLLARDPTRVQELRDVIESDKHVLEG
jgi:HTH-type transcriptional regulator/antitoxin MqsA